MKLPSGCHLSWEESERVGSDRNRRDQDRGRQGENTETDSWVLGVSQGQEPSAMGTPRNV